MKQLAAIVFSLLLIATRTFAVPGAVGGGTVMSDAGCCCDGCQCCVGESSAPVGPPVQAAAPFPVQNLLALPPAVAVSFLLAPPTNDLSFHQAAFVTAASQPLYRRHCALLI